MKGMTQSDWIAVQAPPIDTGEYLATVESSEGQRHVCVASYNADGEWHVGDWGKPFVPISWAHLPAPDDTGQEPRVVYSEDW